MSNSSRTAPRGYPPEVNTTVASSTRDLASLLGPSLSGAAGVESQAFADPANECLIDRIALANAFSAAMGDFHDRFFHDETVGGIHGIGSSSEVLVSQCQDVQGWIEGPQ